MTQSTASETPAPPKSLIVVGGAAGIGAAIVGQAVRQGSRVAVLDRNTDCASRTSTAVGLSGSPPVVVIECDVRSERSVRKAMDRATGEIGIPYGVVCTAAVVDDGHLAAELLDEEWGRVIETNLSGTFRVCRSALRIWSAAGVPGSLVCFSSPAAFVAFPNGTTAYSASKGGISALVRTLAVDYASQGIRVNAVVPGATESDLMWASVPANEVAATRAVVSKEIPLGRLASPDEPARCALWLLSDEAAYVTGIHLVCDGGSLAKASLST